MRRIVIIAAMLVFAEAVGGFSPQSPQRSPGSPSLRRIQVTARSITALASAKRYVVDLTQPRVRYEFDPGVGQIDFSRVLVRTAKGQVAIGSFLEKTFLKDKLAGFKYRSRAFTLGTQPPGTLPTLSTNTSYFKVCNETACLCKTNADCRALASSVICINWFCIHDADGELLCSCNKVPT